MIKHSYNRFDKLYVENGVRFYQTSNVSFVYPKHVERVYRYLRMYYPDLFKYVLGYNPLHTPSFGVWLEFTENTVTLRTQTAHRMRELNLNYVYNTSSKKELRHAIRNIVWNLDYISKLGQN
jgi:hypothetical protein